MIPVLLRPVDWKGTPIGTLKALPIDTRPITTWPDRNAAFEEVAKGIRDVVNEFIAQRRLQLNRQVPDAPENTAQKAEQEDLQGDIQSAITWENMIQQILSCSLTSPLSNHERKIIHSFLKVMPPLELTLLLGIWRSLGETLHQELFLTWKQLSNAERTSLLYAVEKLIDAFGYLSLEDRRDFIEIFMVGAIANSLDQKETLQSSLETWLEEWNETTEEKRREEVDEFIDSLSGEEMEKEKIIEELQKMLQEARNSNETSAQIIERTLQVWKTAEDSNRNTKNQAPPYQGYSQYSQQSPYDQPYQPQGHPPHDNS